MLRYRFTRKAVSDLSDIWNYTYVKWSEDQADKYYQLLINTCGQIADNPGLGKNYSIIIDNLLGFRAGRHIIIYHSLDGDEIEIIRILHEQMDLGIRLKDK